MDWLMERKKILFFFFRFHEGCSVDLTEVLDLWPSTRLSKLGKRSYPFWNAEFLQMAVNFENCRKKWMRADEELVSCKEVLAKIETERGALQVKLKHARNQVDVEIRRRQKAEAVYEKLVGIRANFLECMKKCDVFLTHGFALCYVDGKGTTATAYQGAFDFRWQRKQCSPEWGAALGPGLPQFPLPGCTGCQKQPQLQSKVNS